MLNAPSQEFPAPGSQQRVALAGRSKVPLKPGRSLMDWIRLTKSGKDLTGLKGRLIEVTEEELAKHNKKEDCWICIRGLVYDVTPYMEYHPGGEDELMKAAGSDGTDLFDQVHRWVNYESMLKECLVGRMALKAFAAPLKEICPRVPEGNELLNGTFPKNENLDYSSKDIVPSYDWFQKDDSITVVIYTKQKNMNPELVIADLHSGKLRGEIIVKDYSYLLHVELSFEVHEEVIVQVSEKVGKVEFVLTKREPLSWKTLGQPLESHNSFVKCTDRGLCYRKCKLLSKENVTHDTRLFCLMLPPGTHLQVPVGHHVYLKQTITDAEIVKPYTPVASSLVSKFKSPSCCDKTHIFFMIKIYPSGLFTPVLDALQIGEYISLSNPEGNFTTLQVEEVEELFLLAGGTGFTPMVKLLNYALTSSNTLRVAKLMFFNKTEDDILWRRQLEQLSLNDARFDIQFVLSEPKEGWLGKQGRISSSLLSQFVKRSKCDSKILICICGPLAFMEQGIQFLQDLGHSSKEIHCFTA
ncbi:cytochrome b5 reductase 4 isoform X1 [Anolis carolinensis]|uniref:Cytochrome b5 reductase 4 n=1 Tax=Anolis carolinensis TaxID=28377 RepID=G1KCF2_ANOCA|nr:PREDICTED: cytochrome b5 reductase 4 isoform X1 [Anolis carolinensis]|eukprot:XP_008119917.1 PREDICTED: cytochrome b5 reductase 4 isoform X1 [Anolis carolinensis]